MVTIESQFKLYNNRTTGFDYARIVLALSVLVWHSFGVTAGEESIKSHMSNPYFAAPIQFIVPMFFALSGFLVTMSLYRANSLKVYFVFRGLRLFPALIVEIALAAIILGSLATTLPLGSYFTDFGFYKYFLNMVGLVQYVLPGVFENLPYPRVVNGSLWTIPYELEVYIYLALFYILGLYRSKYSVLFAFLVLTFIAIQLNFAGLKGVVSTLKDMILEGEDVNANLQQATGENAVSVIQLLVPCFFAGSLLYVWREKVPLSWVMCLLSVIISYFLMTSSALFYFAPIFLAYAIIWFGMQTPPLFSLLKKGDYSYGIYLYAFPIQQSILAFNVGIDDFWLHAAVSIIFTSLFAIFSWHCVEKPSLKLKARFL